MAAKKREAQVTEKTKCQDYPEGQWIPIGLYCRYWGKVLLLYPCLEPGRCDDYSVERGIPDRCSPGASHFLILPYAP